MIGDWMFERGCRDRTFVGTKLGFPYQDSTGGHPFRAGDLYLVDGSPGLASSDQFCLFRTPIHKSGSVSQISAPGKVGRSPEIERRGGSAAPPNPGSRSS